MMTSLLLALALGSSALASTPEQERALLAAVKQGDEAQVRTLLAEGTDPNGFSASQRPLNAAMQLDRLSIAELLLDAKASMYGTMIESEYALVWLVRHDRVPMLKLVLRKSPFRSLNTENVLWWAVHEDRQEAAQALLDAGFATDAVTCFEASTSSCRKTSPLGEAIRGNRGAMVELLLAKGAWPGKVTDTGEEVPPLYWAVDRGDLALVQRLIHLGANPSEKTYSGDVTAIRHAIVTGNDALFTALTQDHPLLDDTTQQYCEKTELMLATLYKRPRILKALLALGASPAKTVGSSPQYCAEAGYTALHFAALVGDVEAATVLLAAGADPKAEAGGKVVPLHLASQTGNLALVKLLLSKGIPVDAVDAWTNYETGGECKPLCGATALTRAAYWGFADIAETLIKAGADVNHVDTNGESYNTPKIVGSPLLWAARRGNSAVVDLLIRRKANLDAKDWQGNRVLHAATQAAAPAFQAIAGLLKAAKVDVNLATDEGFTALHWVFLSPQKVADAQDKVAALLKWGAKVDPVTPAKSTPLMYASGLIGPAYPEAVQALLKGGANIALKNNLGYTAVDFARLRGHSDIVRLLCAQAPEVCK